MKWTYDPKLKVPTSATSGGWVNETGTVRIMSGPIELEPDWFVRYEGHPGGQYWHEIATFPSLEDAQY